MNTELVHELQVEVADTGIPLLVLNVASRRVEKIVFTALILKMASSMFTIF
jgi:hypothetical protein